MLHELSHNVHGPHNAEFHALWDQLRKEYEGLVSKGYTGEGFLSEGHKLGGRRIPLVEAKRIASAAAEKRRVLSAGSGQRLGGAPVRAGTDIRQVILAAIDRRNTVLKGCGSDKKNDKEIKDLADQATQNGFKTKAEEDEANDRAISQALWDLVQEDERNERGDSYIPPTPANPTGNGGSDPSPQKPIKLNSENIAASSSNRRPSTGVTRPGPSRPISRLVGEASGLTKKPKTEPKSRPIKKESDTFIPSPPMRAPDPAPSSTPTGWTCPICTLHNPIDYLACDACTIERPEEITRKLAEDARKKAAALQKATQTWRCHQCSTIMEDKWWTCSSCGTMKASS